MPRHNWRRVTFGLGGDMSDQTLGLLIIFSVVFVFLVAAIIAKRRGNLKRSRFAYEHYHASSYSSSMINVDGTPMVYGGVDTMGYQLGQRRWDT